MLVRHRSDKRKNPTMIEVRPMTETEIRALRYGDNPSIILNDGTLAECKVNGAVRTWKRNPSRIEVPIKYGMYVYATFDLSEALRRFVVRAES